MIVPLRLACSFPVCTTDRLVTRFRWGVTHEKLAMKHGLMQPYISNVIYITLNQEMNMQNFLDAFQQ